MSYVCFYHWFVLFKQEVATKNSYKLTIAIKGSINIKIRNNSYLKLFYHILLKHKSIKIITDKIINGTHLFS